MVSRIDEDEVGTLQPIEEYTTMSHARLVRGCSAMQRAIEQLGLTLDRAVRVLASQVQVLSGQVPSVSDASPACPLSEDDLKCKEMQNAMAAQLGMCGLQTLVDGVNEVAVVSGGDLVMAARLPEGIARVCGELDISSMMHVIAAMALRDASKPSDDNEEGGGDNG